MSHFIKQGNSYYVAPEQAMDITKTLPLGTYAVKFNPDRGAFFLDQIEDFVQTGKLYGDAAQHATRILNTFSTRPGSTGVLLSGEKGSGKTMLARVLSLDAAKQGIPTLVVNAPFCGEGFNTFIQNIEQPCVVIFDEFEKVYDEKEQNHALTLLDGVYQSKKLFVITVNDSFKVNVNMKNRPGRLFYNIEYDGLSLAFIREYCNDMLKNKTHIDRLCAISSMFYRFNFDMLKAIVEEMNRYDESPQDALKLLNAKPSNEQTMHTYDITVFLPNGTELDPKYCDRNKLCANLASFSSLYVMVSAHPYKHSNTPITDPEYFELAETEHEEGSLQWDSRHLTAIDPYTGAATLVNDTGHKLVLRRVVVAASRANFYDVL